MVEAEDITEIAGYRIESNSIASGNSLLSLVGGNQNEIGSASFAFAGETGKYRIILGTYDENDGSATVRVAREGTVVNNIVLDNNPGGNAIASNTQVSKVIAEEVSINRGDNFTITGWENASEHARIDYIKFEPVAETVRTIQPVVGGINVNFTVATAAPVTGFIQDVGAAYNSQRGYGWVTQATAGSNTPIPLDMRPNPRDRRNLFDDGRGNLSLRPVGDSFMHMQYLTNISNSHTAQLTRGAWEYDLANGRYQVTVGVGDSDYFDSVHVINVEEEALISDFTPIGSAENDFIPTDAQAFGTGSAIIEVDDGRLTVDAIGGINTKLSYISIVPVDTM